MTAENNQLAVAEPTFVKASTALSQQLGLEPRAMIDAIKTQFFKGKDATDAQLAVVVSTARELGLNPLLPGQLYPYPDRSGAVTIMLGPDGIYTLLANNKHIVQQKDGGPAYWAEHGKDADGKDICTGYVNHATKGLMKKTIWIDEWIVPSNPNWQTRRKHMAEIRAIKQAARLVIHGIPMDTDERVIAEALNVTASAEPAAEEPKTERPAPKPRAPRGAAAAKAAVVDAEVVTTPAAEAAKAPAPADEVPTVMLTNQAGGINTLSKSSSVVQMTEPLAGWDKTANDPAPESTPEPAKVRTSLNEGEAYETEVTVKEITAGIWNLKAKDGAKIPTPGINLTLQGGFIGSALCLVPGAARAWDDGQGATALPPWSVGARLKVRLVGKKNGNIRCESFAAIGHPEVE